MELWKTALESQDEWFGGVVDWGWRADNNGTTGEDINNNNVAPPTTDEAVVNSATAAVMYNNTNNIVEPKSQMPYDDFSPAAYLIGTTPPPETNSPPPPYEWYPQSLPPTTYQVDNSSEWWPSKRRGVVFSPEDPQANYWSSEPSCWSWQQQSEEQPCTNSNRKKRRSPSSESALNNAVPGVYFDKRKKGFRVRFQNVYVGWVSLSRYNTFEEAYAVAKRIWDEAVREVTQTRDKHAAMNAGIPLQIQSRLKSKNPGGRPRTVSRLPPTLDARIAHAVQTARNYEG